MKENSWKEFFEILPIPCIILYTIPQNELVIEEINDAFSRFVGISRKELLGKEISSLFKFSPQKDPFGSRFQFALDEVKESGKKRKLDLMLLEQDTKPGVQIQKYYTVEFTPLKVDERLKSIVVTFKEITHEKQLEKELSIINHQHRNFFRENPDGLFRLNLEGNFLQINEGLAKLAEKEVEDLIERSFLPFCTTHHQEIVLDHFKNAAEGKTASFEADFISAKGRQYILKVLLMPMFQNNKVVEIHGIAKDITGVRQTEKAMVQKSRFLDVSTAFMSSLLENEINNETMHQAFGIIAQTVEADRMYYFGANMDDATGEILISQKVEWSKDRVKPQTDNPKIQNIPISNIKEITTPLTNNLPYTAVLEDLAPGAMKDIFLDQNIKSMLLLPIFFEEQLYGFVGFDDCTNSRTWNEEEISFLKSLTQNLTNAFEKRAALEKAKNREEELIQSEQKFRVLVQEGSDLIAIIDLNGYYSFVSENHKNIIGFDSSELVGKNAYHFIHPDDIERVKQQFFQLKTLKQVNITPYRFRNSSGDYQWAQTVVTNLLNDPAVKGIVSNSRDVTTIVEQAREIEQVNERYQLAATATQDLIYDWDLTRNLVTRFHRGKKKLFGYSSNEFNKKDFWLMKLHPEDLTKEKNKLDKSLKNPEENYITTEYRFRKADGSYARVVDKGYILRDAEGKATRLIGATSDISEITARKEALDIANERFRMAMKATKEVIWDWDINTGFVIRSKGFKAIFGFDTNKTTSAQSFWLDNVAPEDKQMVIFSLDSAINDPRVKKWKLEYRIIKADGKIAHVNDRAYILRDKHRKALRVVGAVQDITDSQKMIGKIQRQNRALKEIAWEQSHVVRAPLARIKGLLQLLEQETCEEMSREQICFHINESANEMDFIIKNIVEKTEEIDI